MSPGEPSQVQARRAEHIRVRGVVQGVGFRPLVWRLAQAHGLRGSVANGAAGVDIRVCGDAAALEAFVRALQQQVPPLARIESLERQPLMESGALDELPDFRILDSQTGSADTGVAADAACCDACIAEVFDPFSRRYRYPFTNCTHCGPRLSIVSGIPFDRSATTMREFSLCADCQREFDSPGDRRFHAQAIACYVCGPRAWLERADGAAIAVDSLSMLDAVDAACTLLQRGHIVAIKGLGGFQLACDATRDDAVTALRAGKGRLRKPLALMARDVDVIREYARVTDAEQALLRSAEAPIVLLDALPEHGMSAEVAPGLNTLGFMLPNTPLHHLMLRRMQRPIVVTSGNLSDEPQCTDNQEALSRLGSMAEYFLMHDRDVARRVDDTLARVVAQRPRRLRAARGAAPGNLVLGSGFESAPAVLAMGAELKNGFCLLAAGRAVTSHHIGDLEHAATWADYQRAQADYSALFAHEPAVIAVDQHPDYLASKFGREQAAAGGLPVCEVQHHHAHVAACMAENRLPADTPALIGVVLDGLGYGDGGELWGGEFLLADYRQYRRIGSFKPVALPGAAAAMREPWRNTWAHLMAEMGWARFEMNYRELELFAYLQAKPREVLEQMLAGSVNSPLASSCGRLFDAVAAAVGLCRERLLYEGQAAMELEALVDHQVLASEGDELAYPFGIPRLPGNNLRYIEPLAMWQALLGDLVLKTPVPVIAARFHKGLAIAIARMVAQVSRDEHLDAPVHRVCLSGGVFQNRVLFEQVHARLCASGFEVFSHAQVPANDGGLALGQAAIAALSGATTGDRACV